MGINQRFLSAWECSIFDANPDISQIDARPHLSID